MSFEEFVMEFQPQATWFYRLSQAELLGAVRLDGVVRFERLGEDLLRLPPIAAAIGAGEVLEPLSRLNATSHSPGQEVCTAGLVAGLTRRWSAALSRKLDTGMVESLPWAEWRIGTGDLPKIGQDPTRPCGS